MSMERGPTSKEKGERFMICRHARNVRDWLGVHYKWVVRRCRPWSGSEESYAYEYQAHFTAIAIMISSRTRLVRARFNPISNKVELFESRYPHSIIASIAVQGECCVPERVMVYASKMLSEEKRWFEKILPLEVEFIT